MKRLRKLLSLIVTLSLMAGMIAAVLPPLFGAHAAEVIYRYELDTDGVVDAGADYLIVNTNATGTAHALRFYYGSMWSRDFRDQTVTVKSDPETGVKYIEVEFDYEDDCRFRFSGSTGGRITHGDYAVDLPDGAFVSGTPDNTLTFTNQGGGGYRIHCTSYWRTYYLRYSNNDWSGGTSSSTVYLYKLVEYVVSHDVTYNANGATEGTLPADASDLDWGAEYTVLAPTNLRKDSTVEDDSWVFRCWNTAPDGTGTDYNVGDKITINGDVTLYAQWDPVVKYDVQMITYMDGERTDVDVISGQDKTFYIQLESGDGSYISMRHTDTGVYTAKVEHNGTYVVYSRVGDGDYEPVHGHKVMIYNQSGTTECLHYSIIHDLKGGSWPDGFTYDDHPHHAGETHYAPTATPVLEGNRFLGWQDTDGNIYQPGYLVTASIDKPLVLTALWENTVDVIVNVTIDHNSADSGYDNNADKDEVTFDVMRTDEDGFNHLVGTITVTKDQHGDYTYTFSNGVTSYVMPNGKVTFGDLQKGNYTVSLTKSYYEATYETTKDEMGNTTIQIDLKYTPTNFDMDFDVVIDDWANVPTHLRPQAVNVKVTYWGYNADGVLGWHIITQQDGAKPPVAVAIDPETGKGSGFFPVWKYWADTDNVPYYYRVAVTAYLMADGTLVPAASEDDVHYVGGIYNGTVSIVPDGGKPDYPEDSDTDLKGTIYSDTLQQQDSTPTVTVQVKPFTVTFKAEPGTVGGAQTLVLTNQHVYPDLNFYVAIPETDDIRFICWLDENGELAVNNGGQLLSSDVVYTARYNENITIAGEVTVPTTYLQDGQTVHIHDIDLPEEVLVILQKKVGEIYNDVDSVRVKITYPEEATEGVAVYEFANVPNDGTEYRIYVQTLNYGTTYDNNGDAAFSADESAVIVNEITATAKVDAYLQFDPDSYQQAVKVDSTLIHEDLRPTNAVVQILYRDMGDHFNYKVISQHTVSPYGVEVPMNGATGLGFEYVWNWHTNGTLYEYQAQVFKLYGTVECAYTADGVEYSANLPYTIRYGQPNNYYQQTLQGGVMLTATLVPKEYPIILDLNLDGGNAVVRGLEDYIVDDGKGGEMYAYMHTWSFRDEFIASPYREGYVFKGWTSSNKDVYTTATGMVNVGAQLAETVTLTAQWEKLNGTDYTVRHLELNTDKVLHAAQSFSGVAAGYPVVAADAALTIPGYEYAGAMVDDVFRPRMDNPTMTVTTDPLKNTIVIYYLPDGSDGYTEQVESNLNIDKTAVLEDNGTYTITLSTFTKDNPITTLIQQNTPLDIVLVLDQSGSLAANNFAYLTALQNAVENFVESVADHGRKNEVDHRIAMVGFAGNASDGHSSDPVKATGTLTTGTKETDSWINTGVFDSNGDFHLYTNKGFNYTLLSSTANMTPDNIYYTKVTKDGQDSYLLLTYHSEYYHRINDEQARLAYLQNEIVLGYVYDELNQGGYVELTRNSSGLWLYGDRKLYSGDVFFTYHTDVWTHRDGVENREIHAYGVGADYRPIDGHEGVYTRTVVTNAGQQSIYKDALVPVTLGAEGSGDTNPSLMRAIQRFGADGATRARYGMELANEVMEANPIDPASGRLRLVVMFTDGEPGYLGFDKSYSQYDYYEQAVEEANAAINYAYTSKNEYGAYVYAIGLYKSGGVEATSDVAYYMNALSSNYPNAKKMDDIKATTQYVRPEKGTPLENNGKFFYYYNRNYYEIEWGYVTTSGNWRQHYCWYYTRGTTNYEVSTATNPDASTLNNVYQQIGGYKDTEHSGYYATTESADQLNAYFEDVLQDITTKITTEIELNPDTILRDIMNQGLVLTDGTVITAYKQPGEYDPNTGGIIWQVDDKGNPVLQFVADLNIGEGERKSDEMANILGTDGVTVSKTVPYLEVYNYGAANPTNPDEPDGVAYHPHTVDITGYDFTQWYINENHTSGFKMVVTITRVEARDDVEWGRSTSTNHDQSGLWLPADEYERRELLLAFNQPTTIFVERAYVLDYGKEFTLKDWYFDDDAENGQYANPIHVDCNIANGMNWFDPANPTLTNLKDGKYGNTKYGNVRLENGEVKYAPTTMSWGGYDQFYVFGNTWRRTVLAQDANENGNLWNKVTVIPANNVYYEDSFITTDNATQNGIDGFTFGEGWVIVGGDGDNVEIPEHQEEKPYGDVHGWTDSLDNDFTYTDGSAHGTGLDGKTKGATATFTFTGTGAEVYTRTNAKSGMVVAILTNAENQQVVKSIAVDNLAVSGDYYHIPTVSFKNLPYGTYTVQLIATVADVAVEGERYEYYIDGVRVYNPLGSNTNYQSDVVKDAYGLEMNAVFTEVRDILLKYEDFNKDMEDDAEGVMGAVFIDWIQDGQQSGSDESGVGVPTYEIGTYEKYGPKNEVYLSKGQAIVLKVQEGNTYYVGLKSLTGKPVTVNVSGIDLSEPTEIALSHTTDMYYQVTPINGYIVIQNGCEGDEILSITNLRTTNLTAPVDGGGILPVAEEEAIEMMEMFTAYLLTRPEEEPMPEVVPPVEEETMTNEQLTDALFADVRVWLETV